MSTENQKPTTETPSSQGGVRERFFTQNINGTIFKYRLLKEVGERNGVKWLSVQNIETGYIQTITESELKEE